MRLQSSMLDSYINTAGPVNFLGTASASDNTYCFVSPSCMLTSDLLDRQHLEPRSTLLLVQDWQPIQAMHKYSQYFWILHLLQESLAWEAESRQYTACTLLALRSKRLFSSSRAWRLIHWHNCRVCQHWVFLWAPVWTVTVTSWGSAHQQACPCIQGGLRIPSTCWDHVVQLWMRLTVVGPL